MADLPLPRLGTLGIGIARFAGLILALVASPRVERLLRPAVIPGLRFHIAAPGFATVAPRGAPAAALAKPQRIAHAKRPAGRPPVAGLSPPLPDPPPAAVIRTAPAALPVSAHSIAVTQAPPQPAPGGTAAATPQPSAPAASDETEDPPAATQHKRHFWSKGNVFRKRHPAAEEKLEEKP